jgi:protein gp37
MVHPLWLERGFPSNVWIGVSVENQEMADKRIPTLLEIPAAVRFLSCEPLLGPVSLDDGEMSWLTCHGPIGEDEECCESFWARGEHYHGIDWVICGGESGAKARPMNPEWARSLRDQCAGVGVPFFYKQTGEWTTEYPGLGRHGQTYQHGMTFYKVGKHRAGRLLDGREWNEYPATGVQVQR